MTTESYNPSSVTSTERGESIRFSKPPRTIPDPELFRRNIPEFIRQLPRFVVWRYEYEAPTKTKPEGSWTKVPYQARNPQFGASSTDPATWSDLDTAVAVFMDDETLDGIGVMCGSLGDDLWLAMVDLDHCIIDGIIADWALEYINASESYSERSPRDGVRILGTTRLVWLVCGTRPGATG